MSAPQLTAQEEAELDAFGERFQAAVQEVIGLMRRAKPQADQPGVMERLGHETGAILMRAGCTAEEVHEYAVRAWELVAAEAQA